MASNLSFQLNHQMDILVQRDPTKDCPNRPEVDRAKIAAMVASVGRCDTGLYVFLLDHWHRSRFERLSDSVVYDNGSATSFKLQDSLSKTGRLGAAAAVAVAHDLSDGVFGKLAGLGVYDAGAIVVLSWDEPGREGWDYRFFAGEGARHAANDALIADQPVASFEMVSELT